jgi:hypothetical protein
MRAIRFDAVSRVRRTVAVFGVVLAGLLISTRSVEAQRPEPCDESKPRKTFGELMVVRTCSGGNPAAVYTTSTRAELSESVVVLVRGLGRFVSDQAEKKPPEVPVDLTKVVLFLNGQPLKGVEPVQTPSPQFSHFVFRLKPNAAVLKDAKAREAWNALLSDGVRRRPVSLSVGFEGQAPLRTEVDDFTLIAIPARWGVVSLVLAGALFGLIVWLGRKSNALRDQGAEPAGARKTYSLARVQMACWFYVVLTAYVFIWMITGELDTLTPTVLGLMGISAATTVAGGAIDAGTAGGAPAAASPTKGFFIDLLSDANGMTLPRLQTAMWTVVLIGIFAISVFRQLAMPEFDATLLGLMGISNGTYLALKGTEH